MFPLGDQNAGMRFKPWVLYAIIAANFIVWIYETTLNRIQLNKFFDSWAARPVDIMDGEHLYTLYTSAYLHGSWGHILGNMLFLWLFGNNIENLMGHFRFFVFYSLCAIAGSGLHVLMNQDSAITLVGASGAIAGVMGAYMVSFPRGKIRTAVFLWIIPVVFMLPAWIWIGIWIGSQLLWGIGSLDDSAYAGAGVAYFAHVGGFIAGALLVFPFRDKEVYEQMKAAGEQYQSYERMGPLEFPFRRSKV